VTELLARRNDNGPDRRTQPRVGQLLCTIHEGGQDRVRDPGSQVFHLFGNQDLCIHGRSFLYEGRTGGH